MSWKIKIEPSAPPPLLKSEAISASILYREIDPHPNLGEIEIASWNIRRKAE